MNRKRVAMWLIGATVLPTGLTIGCASEGANQQPYALTGPQAQAQADQRHAEWRQQLAYTDQKGKFRPEFANRDQPIGYSQ